MTKMPTPLHHFHPGGEHLYHIVKRNSITFTSCLGFIALALVWTKRSSSSINKWRFGLTALISLYYVLSRRKSFQLDPTSTSRLVHPALQHSGVLVSVEKEKRRAYYEFLLHCARQLALPAEHRDPSVWGMRGALGQFAGVEVGPVNAAFTAIRYHAAFLAYAIATYAYEFSLHYVEDTKMALRNVVECLLRHESWSYMESYWPGEKPLQCRENVMWSGHVLHCATLYELLTGDKCYRRPNGLVCRGRNGEVVDVSDVETLANLCASVMDSTKSGGMACEPGLVFPQCQSHVFIAHLILETLTNSPGKYKRQRDRWETYLLTSMKATLSGGGAYTVFVHDRSGLGLPFAHLGSDGWASHYHFAWSRDVAIPRSIWWQESRPALASFDTLNDTPTLEHHGSASCCLPLAIPASVWVGSLLPVAAMAGDAEFSQKIQDWLERHFSKPVIKVNERLMFKLDEGPEWLIGTTSNFLQGLVLMHNPDALRKLVTEFRGIKRGVTPLITEMNPYESCRVLLCEFCEDDDGDLGRAFTITLSLKKMDPDLETRDVFLYMEQVTTVQEVTVLTSLVASGDIASSSTIEWVFELPRLRLRFNASVRELSIRIRIQ